MSGTDPRHCAICGEPNDCAMAEQRPLTECWCATATIDPAALARVPEEKRGKVCLCPSCAGGKR